MRLHAASVPANQPSEVEAELNRFLASHRVLSIDRHMVTHGPDAYWAVAITYLPQADNRSASGGDPARRATRVDYREVLSDEDSRVFAQLRGRRKALAERDAVPPYALAGYATSLDRGLPNGALTSQHSANLDLDPIDRHALERLGSLGYRRYMDDFVSWWPSRAAAVAALHAQADFAASLGLSLHPRSYVGSSARGVAFLGHRLVGRLVFPPRRRRHRFRRARARAETAYTSGAIGAVALQSHFDAALASLADTASQAWRSRELARRPPRMDP